MVGLLVFFVSKRIVSSLKSAGPLKFSPLDRMKAVRLSGRAIAAASELVFEHA